jgi:TolB-like protein/DNA-binding winged helix-turn-helix (wHTH) protein
MEPDFHIGEYLIRPQRDCVERGGKVIHVAPKAMAVLVCLAGAPGQVFTRQELFDAVWPGAVVSDEALTQRVAELRKALGDSAHDPQYIETIPKVGFRLIPPVLERSPGHVESAAPIQSSASPVGRTLGIASLILVLVAVLAFLYSTIDKDVPAPIDEEGVPSIAVLPFINMSEDPGNVYFSDGVSEELLNLLAGIPDLRVISRSSSFSFRDKGLAIPELARQLNVTHVLEGSVRKSGSRIRITAQLIDARSDNRIWSDSYDRELHDIFAVQKEIATAISGALKVALRAGGSETVTNARKLTENMEAYENYLRGRYLWQRRGEDNIRQAIHLFEQAKELDPKLARAWSSVAAAYITLPGYLTRTDSTYLEALDDFRHEAWSAAMQALELDDSLAEAHAVLGEIAHKNREWSEAEGHYLRAIANEPKNSTAHLWYSEFLGNVGRSRDALNESLIAYQLDPMNGGTHNVLTSIYWQLNDTDNAVKYGTIGWELGNKPYWSAGLRIQALVNLRLEKFETAIAFAEKYDKYRVHSNGYPVGVLKLHVEAKIDPAKTHLYLETLKEHEKEFSSGTLIRGYVDFGRIDDAYRVAKERLDQLITLRWFIWNPEMTTFRQDPRFVEIAAQLGLLDYWRDNGWPDLCQPDGESAHCK